MWPFGSTRSEMPTAPASRDPSDNFWFEKAVRQAAAGVEVTVARARTVPVVRDTLWILASSIAGLGSGVFQRVSHDERQEAKDHPIAQLLRRPNPEMTSFEFIASLVDDLAAEGAFYGELEWDPQTGAPRHIWRIEPRHARLERLPDRSTRLRINEPGRPERILVRGEFWHIPLPPLTDGYRGSSPITKDGKEAIAAAIALQQFANRFFANDATPPFVIKQKGHFKDQASKDNFLNAWQRWVGGKNRGKPGILEYDMDIQELSHTNEASQFLETRRELWLDCARLWRMQPHKVGILDKATFSNIEHQGLEFVTDTLTPWLELIERSVNHWLIDDDRFYFEFNVASLLRGDVKARYEAYALGRQWGFLSVNEIRRLENRNGIGPAGDRFIEPLNMTAVGAPPANDQQKAIAFLRDSVARSGGRPNLKVIQNAA